MLEIARIEWTNPVSARLSASSVDRSESLAHSTSRRGQQGETSPVDRSALRVGSERLEALARHGAGSAGRAQALGEVVVARAELAEARLQAEEAPAPLALVPQMGPAGFMSSVSEAPRPVMAPSSASKAGAIAVARGRVESARAHLVAARTLS